MKIELIYQKLKNLYPEYELILLNGGLIDLDGANTTTMELGLYDLNYELFKFNRKFVKQVKLNKKEKYSIHEFTFEKRLIHIIVTSNNKLLKDKVLIRNNEIMLNNFSLLLSQVLMLNKMGYSKNDSWGMVLDLEKPYDSIFLLNTKDLQNKAECKSDYLNKVILKSRKKIPEL